MRYVLGVDGGQSSTIAVVADEDGNLLGVGAGGPANHLNEPGGPDRFRRSMTDAITGAIGGAGLVGQPMAAACFGLTGGAAMVPEVLASIVPVGKLRIESDVVTALAAATICRPGVIIIGGTGANAFGVNERGEQAQAGGWGFMMGDEGSGYDIAIRGLRAAVQASDGRAPATVLQTAIPAHFGVKDLRAELHPLIYSGQLGRPRIASIARVVSAAANAGDGPSLAIMAEAAGELAKDVLAVLSKLGALDSDVPVAPIGGVFKSGAPVLVPFAEAIHRRAPRVRVQVPEFPQIIGAVLLAYQDIGRTLDDALVGRLREGLPLIERAK